MRRKAKPDLWRAGLAGKSENRGWFSMSSLRGSVNLSGLFFQNRSLAGLLVSGFWAERLSMWLPALDMAARMLRDAVEGRV